MGKWILTALILGLAASAVRADLRSMLELGTPVLKGPDVEDAGLPYSKAIGKLGGCTATRVSAPGAPITAVLYAAHCPGASTFTVDGKQVGGFHCFYNRDYPARRKAPGYDVGLCFSRTPMGGSVYGCLGTGRDQAPRRGDRLRMFGYGPPVRPPACGAPRCRLATATARLDSFRRDGTFFTRDTNFLTRGDSGGPVIRDEEDFPNGFDDDEEGDGDLHGPRGGGAFDELRDGLRRPSRGAPFTILGVNALWVSPDRSGFAPVGSAANRAFFRRAVAAGARRLGTMPRVCGVNDRRERPRLENFDDDWDLRSGATGSTEEAAAHAPAAPKANPDDYSH